VIRGVDVALAERFLAPIISILEELMDASANITAAVFAAHLKCPTKAYLIVHREKPPDNFLADTRRRMSAAYKARVIGSSGTVPVDFSQLAAGLVIEATNSYADCETTSYAFPPSEGDRVAALLKLWLGGTVMACAVINLLVAALDYSPARPGPDPVGGFLMAAFVLSLFISCGIWAAFSAVLSPEFALRGALVTGILLFVAVVALGFLVAG
jgi:hypothetical protein